MTQEVLETGRPPRQPRPWVAYAVGGVVLVLISMLSIAALADLAARTVEMNNLLTRVEASEAAMKAAQDEVAAALEPYSSGEMTDADRAKVRTELADIAARGRATIAEAGAGVADVRVMTWHRGIRDGQRAYYDHNAAWVAYLTKAEQNPETWFESQPDVNRTWDAAKAPLVSGVTVLDFGGALQRIQRIYDDGGADDSGGSSSAGQPA
ncbi:MAG: hypothetical protein ACR2KE_00195 [Candidatus Nanopelagicales bacterium]